MKNKAFTLMEMLAVIVILAMLLLIGAKAIATIIRKSRVELSELQIESIKSSAKALANDNLDYLPSNNHCKYITLDDLYFYGYFNDKVINPKNNQEYSNIYISVCSSKNELLNKESYNYELKYLDESGNVDVGMNPFFLTEPNLYNNKLTPIVYVQLKFASASSDTVLERKIITNTISESSGYYYRYEWQVPYDDDIWYDYSNQMWANAVILHDNVIKMPGDTVDVDLSDDGISDTSFMFVWVPRFSYTLKCQNSDLTNCYGNYEYAEKVLASSDVSKLTPGAIDIKFISKDTKNNQKGKYSGNKVKDWKTMPAFTISSENDLLIELDGIWVGKFETGAINSSYDVNANNNLGCVDDSCSSVNELAILPNIKTVVNNDVSNAFYASSSINNSLKLGSDVHMLKNSEWDVVSYLSQSLYGKYGNINYRNENKEVSPNTTSSQYSILTGSHSNKTYYYNSMDSNNSMTIGGSSSTTGNIYGIYDMVGGAWEYVMGNYSNIIGSSGFLSFDNLEKKYVDIYNQNNDKYSLNFYDDGYISISSSNPWIIRGYTGTTETSKRGIFSYSYMNGSYVSPDYPTFHGYTFRIGIFKNID